MIPELTYQLFTIKELRAYLLHNVDNGITPEMISRPRAYALINNPHALDTDIVLSTVKQGDKALGYTAVFAECLARPFNEERIFWGTTQYVDPSLRGKGVAGTMLMNLKDAIKGRYLGLESSVSSVKLDIRQGSKVQYFPKYNYQVKSSKKNFKSLILENIIRLNNKKFLKYNRLIEVEIRHINFIDDEVYRFIKSNSGNDIFLRKQEMFNWMIHYPFLLSKNNSKYEGSETCIFGGCTNSYQLSIIEIFSQNERIGVAFYTVVDGVFTLRYVYYNHLKETQVFMAITQEIFLFDIRMISFCSLQFKEFLDSRGFTKMNKRSFYNDVSFTYYESFNFDSSKQIQGGDGDMFC